MDTIKQFFHGIFTTNNANNNTHNQLKEKQKQWAEKLGRNLDTKCMICFKDISEINQIWCEPKPSPQYSPDKFSPKTFKHKPYNNNQNNTSPKNKPQNINIVVCAAFMCEICIKKKYSTQDCPSCRRKHQFQQIQYDICPQCEAKKIKGFQHDPQYCIQYMKEKNKQYQYLLSQQEKQVKELEENQKSQTELIHQLENQKSQTMQIEHQQEKKLQNSQMSIQSTASQRRRGSQSHLPSQIQLSQQNSQQNIQLENNNNSNNNFNLNSSNNLNLSISQQQNQNQRKRSKIFEKNIWNQINTKPIKNTKLCSHKNIEEVQQENIICKNCDLFKKQGLWCSKCGFLCNLCLRKQHKQQQQLQKSNLSQSQQQKPKQQQQQQQQQQVLIGKKIQKQKFKKKPNN